MAKEDALRFLEQTKTDQELVEKVRAALVGGNAPSFAAAAADLGFSFTDEEFQEASAELRQAELDQLEGVELDDAELEQVAGGGDNYNCSDTYREGENCWADDQCDRILNYYKGLDACDYTYDPRESCYNLDRSWGGIPQ